MSELNQAAEIFNHILSEGPITAEKIASDTGWNHHVVDIVIAALVKHGYIYQAGKDTNDDQTYNVVVKIAM